jgi:3-dehydroquinate synthase
VVVGAGVLSTLGARCRDLFGAAAKGGRIFVIADNGLPGLTIEMAVDALRTSGRRVELASMTPSEPAKSMKTVERLVTHMAATRLERGEPVVALGGGIVGDVAGFAASIYRRGVPVVQCPTTLLAMVDASVGGKTGVNLALPAPGGGPDEIVLKKNMVGTFHQPALVMCDAAVLGSLPDDELSCGFAECVKHALIGADWQDPGLYDWIAAHAARLMARDPELLVELIARNVAIKARVVEGDEREERVDGRGRMCLNMGHTIGHAIETMPVHAIIGGKVRPGAGLKHGEAVGLGLIAEAACGEHLGITRKGLADQLIAILGVLGLPTSVHDLPPMSVIAAAMGDDKKVGGSRVRMAMPTGRGGCEVVTGPDERAIAAGIKTIESKM